MTTAEGEAEEGSAADGLGSLEVNVELGVPQVTSMKS
jgi:hypothetical protein